MSGCVTSPAPSQLKKAPNANPTERSFLSTAKVACLELGCGGMAGSMGIFLGIPFDLVKVRMQSLPLKYTSTLQTFHLTVREDGFTGLYRGMMAPIASQVFINALVFASESTTIKYLEPHLQPGEVSTSRANHFLAGMVGGAAQCIVLVPTDVIKCRMQVDSGRSRASALSAAPSSSSGVGGSGSSQATTLRQFTGSLDCAQKIFAQEGIRGMYKGLMVTALRELPSIGCYFTVYKYMREKLDKAFGAGWGVTSTIFAGGIAGCASWTVVYPLDVIKTNIQTATLKTPTHEALEKAAAGSTSVGHTKAAQPLGLTGTATRLYRQGGPGAFFRGLAPTLLRAFPVNGITFLVYERLKREAGLI